MTVATRPRRGPWWLPPSSPSTAWLPPTSSAPRDWLAGDPWRLPASPNRVEHQSGGAFVCRAAGSIRAVSPDGGEVVIEGRMVPYNEWAEIRSRVEGHFMERFMPGSLKRTIAENGNRVRALFEHGLDATLGRQIVANVDSMWEQPDGAYFRATLLDGLPALLVAGIRRNLYGSSVRFSPVSSDRVRSPARSLHNPEGIPEVTVWEASLREFSVTPFPAYGGATAAAAA